jgi:flagellar basal-body rod modification protein FlgD
MIDSTGFTGSVPPATSRPASRTDLGKAEFMTLLLTQLQHQDPMNPLEAHEFAAQLADFTSVDELGQINQALAYQLESLQLSAALSETSFSAALVGKTVIAEGDQINVTDRESVEITVDIGDGGGNAVLRLFDADGNQVVSRDLGHMAGGRQTLEVPDDLGDGLYRYELEVTDGTGGAVSVKNYVTGSVGRILFENGQILLSVGGVQVGLGSLIEITAGSEG